MEKKYTPKEYEEYVNKVTPSSKTLRNMFYAFIVGGAICVIGQIIIELLINTGMDEETASSFTTMSMIFLGIFLTSINVYDDIGRFAGAGSMIPVTGFANSIVSPAIEFKSEGYIMGVGAKMFTVAGPVLVYGISSSIVLGIIYFIINV